MTLIEYEGFVSYRVKGVFSEPLYCFLNFLNVGVSCCVGFVKTCYPVVLWVDCSAVPSFLFKSEDGGGDLVAGVPGVEVSIGGCEGEEAGDNCECFKLCYVWFGVTHVVPPWFSLSGLWVSFNWVQVLGVPGEYFGECF